ncbi:MAG: transporter substrate-binding domain-containing protein [Erysipelotrichaceae bacterium]
MKKIVAIAMSLFLVAGCSNGGSETKVLKALTSSGYDPYEIVDENGKLTGFDIELAEAIAKELGYTIAWTDMDFDGLIGALVSGQGDLAIAGITPDPKRAESVDFSISYYEADEETSNYVLYAAEKGYSKDADLKGLIAGYQIGTIQEAAVLEIQSSLNLQTDPRSSLQQIVQEIKVGRIDFVVVEKAVADQFIALNPELAAFKLESATSQSSGNALAFPKGSELTEAFNEQLAIMKESGALQTLVDKWFKK